MTARLRILCACTLAATLLCCHPSLAKDSPEEKARPLLKAASERSLFHADRSAPFGLVFKFQLRTPGSKPTPGAYSWLLTPEGDWRKEMKFLDYSDLRIYRGNTLWAKRNIDFRPLQAGRIEGALSNFVYVDRAEDEITRYSTTSEHHVDLRCVDVRRDRSSRKFCFDADNNLRKVEEKRRSISSDVDIVYEYSDFKQLGKKFAPSKILAKRDGFVVLDGSIETLTPVANLDPSLLTPPVDAVKRNGCLTPSLPKEKETSNPHYPATARSEHQQGTVVTYALIGNDGLVKKTEVIQTGGQALDAAVLDAVRKWQFEPAKCGDVPVDFEVEVAISFEIR